MALAALTPLLVVALVVVGCPPRETEIAISESGAALLISTCNTGAGTLDAAEQTCRDLVDDCEQASCDALDCDQLGELCDGIDLLTLTPEFCDEFASACSAQVDECNLPQSVCDDTVGGCFDVIEAFGRVCGVAALDDPDVTGGRPLRLGVRVVLTRGIGTEALTASGCGVAEADGADVAGGLNAAIAEAIGEDGLQHPDVEEPQDALPLLLVFHDRDGDGVTCASEELFACAALGLRSPSEESYDILCGSCQKGLLPPVSTAPCNQDCILDYCLSLL